MKTYLIPFTLLLIGTAASSQDQSQTHWSAAQLAVLQSWLDDAPNEALAISKDTGLANSMKAGDIGQIDAAANAAAMALAHAHLFGCSKAYDRSGWQIASDDDEIDLAAWLRDALRRNNLDGFYRSLRPQHSDYEKLRIAYRSEIDPAKKLTLARNMERWRWMPLNLGSRYLLANTASYEVGLWSGSQRVQKWPVIVGKARTPTPVFSAQVTGVTFNPWWDIPQSIVAESVGSLTRNRPGEARRRGYVWGNGSYRQKPGPTNALGRMKLVMANPFSVYLHDTPNKGLFNKTARAFSHGCIRVGNALGFAATLLGGNVKQGRIDAILAGNQTTVVPLEHSIPVYIVYFTADTSGDGTLTFHDDHYGRDKKMGDSKNPIPDCPA